MFLKELKNREFPFYISFFLFFFFPFSITICQILTILLFLLWFFEKIKHRKFEVSKFTLLFFIFVGIRILTVWTGIDRELGLKFLYKKLFFSSIFLSIQSQSIIKRKEDIIFFLKTMVLSGIIAGIIALIMIILPRIGVFEELIRREFDFFGGAFRFSEIMMIITLTGLSFWNSFLFIIPLFDIFFTLVRSSVIAIFISGILKFFIEKKWVYIGIILFISAGALLYSPLRTKFYKIVKGEERSLSGREILWEEAKKIIFKKPILGFGPGSFEKIVPEEIREINPHYRTWHSDYLQIYLESGIIGLLSYLALLIYALFCLFKHPTGRILFYPLLGMSIMSLTGGLIWDTVHRIILFSFLGFASLLN